MKIAVCIKHVPVDGNVEVDPQTHRLIRENSASDINPCDLNAMELALQLKKTTEAVVDVFTMGPDFACSSLKKCLALGADNAYLISDRKFAGGDTVGTARVLAGALAKTESYDVVITGAESSDGATGQVGPMLAQALGMPSVAEATEAALREDGRLAVKKKLSDGSMSLAVALPCLLTVPFGCNEPERPTLRAQMKANKREIPVLDQNTLQLEESGIGMGAALSVVTSLAAAKTKKSAERLTGTPAELAAQLTALVEQRRG